MTAAVRLIDVALRYSEVPVLTGVRLTVAAGEVMALLGPSGSGKTTLLHAVAGFVAPSAGEIWLAGQTVAGPGHAVPPEKRRVGMVFQTYALWPHMTVVEIVAYPIRRRGTSATDARRRALDLLARLDLAALAERRPAELSGGEQQRVGLARALAADPQVFLFDEPTAHLDAHLRAVVLAEVAARRAETAAAALYATHDSAEALAIADRVAVLHSGGVVQVGAPTLVYAEPADLTVARLTGPVSVLDADIRPAAAATVTVRLGGGSATAACAAVPSVAARPVLVRPDWATLDGDLPGVVEAVRFGGPHSDYAVRTPGGTILIRESGPPRRAPGERTGWSVHRVWPAAGTDGRTDPPAPPPPAPPPARPRDHGMSISTD